MSLRFLGLDHYLVRDGQLLQGVQADPGRDVGERPTSNDSMRW